MSSAAASRPVGAVTAALLGMAASTLQQTLLATATPTIVAEMGTPSAYAWVSGAYLLASTLTLPWAGAVTDRVGARPMYAAGMGLFGLGTCGVVVSASMGWLLAWRVVQGVGAGTLVPAALAVVGALAGDRQRGRVFGAMAAVQVLANIAGPLVGGWFTAGWGWRWAMAVTMPLVLVGWLIAWVSMPCRAHDGAWWRTRSDSTRWRAVVPGLGPLLVVAFLVGGLTVATVTYLPWALDVLHHVDAAQIGYRLLPMLLASAVGSALGGALASHARALSWCWAIISASLALALGTSPAWLTAAGVGVGLGCGAALPVLLTRVQALAGEDQLAWASSLMQLARHGGAAVLVPTLGAWSAFTAAPLAAPGLLACLVLVALCGLVISWRTP